MASGEPPVAERTRPLNILSIDSGGIYGLSPLLILQTIGTAISIASGTESENFRPCDHFDLIAGSGMGGILALMLGRLRLTVDQAITEYIELSRICFKPPGRFLKTSFDEAPLESFLQHLVSRYADNDPNASLSMGPEQTRARVVVTASRMSASDSPPRIFRSHSIENSDSQADDTPIWHWGTGYR